MTNREITNRLFELRDEGYAKMQEKIIPTVDPERIIGVRTPELRALAKELVNGRKQGESLDGFLKELPHRYFDEDQLHAFIISLEKDFDVCVAEVETFLPYVDNWATCDQMSPKVFKKQPERLLPYITRWIGSGDTYTVRFAMGMLMEHFLGDNFNTGYADLVAGVRSEEYYVNMMAAWYFATALAKQYESVLPYLTERRLPVWTHNKTIQKAVESYRITPEQKEYLRTLRIKKA
ncbi:MAG: DNA alkylation repair protein [Lachnospiraceae bacterium]|nr:DNA alkylation repair protein [Lachnospiraceae bacterium]